MQVKEKVRMKKYLRLLTDEMDYVTTQIEGKNDWRAQIIEVIYKHLKEHSNSGRVTLEMIFKDMEKAIKCQKK